MSVLTSSSLGKKLYQRAACSLKSREQVGALLRKERPDQEEAPRPARVSAQRDAPILIVESYQGELEFIGQPIPAPARQLEALSILKGGGVVEMQIADAPDSASPETFFLLDLRHRHHGERGLLDSIGGIPYLRDGHPLVILVSSIEQFDSWRGISATN